MMGQIRKTAAKDTLTELQVEGLVFTREAVDEVQAWIEEDCLSWASSEQFGDMKDIFIGYSR